MRSYIPWIILSANLPYSLYIVVCLPHLGWRDEVGTFSWAPLFNINAHICPLVLRHWCLFIQLRFEESLVNSVRCCYGVVDLNQWMFTWVFCCVAFSTTKPNAFYTTDEIISFKMQFIWSKSTSRIESYDYKKINHENLLGPVLHVLPHRKSINNHCCVHFSGEIGPSTNLNQSSSHHNFWYEWRISIR